MKCAKIQKDIIDFKLVPETVCEFEDSMAIVNLNNIFFIPKKLWLLDTDTFKRMYDRGVDIEALMRQLTSNYPAMLTGDFKKTKLNNRNLTVLKIANTDSQCWVDEKLISMFENPTFEIKNETTPIKIFEDGVLVGLVCPIRVKDVE